MLWLMKWWSLCSFFENARGGSISEKEKCRVESLCIRERGRYGR